MHDSMQYDPIQGYLLPHLQWGLANDHGFLH